MNKENRSKHGAFTLIELLVVIAIIGMLSAITLVSLNGARMKARDARRKVDIGNIITALNFYYDKYGHYPREPYNGVTANIVNSLRPQPWIQDEPGGVGTGGGEGSLTEFMNPIAIDPSNHSVATVGNGRFFAGGAINRRLLAAAFPPTASPSPSTWPVPDTDIGPWQGDLIYAYTSDATGSRYDLVTLLENHSDSEICQSKCKMSRVGTAYNGGNTAWCSPCGSSTFPVMATGNYTGYIYGKN